MKLDRRGFLIGSAVTLATSAQADDRREYRDYLFKDYFREELKGTFPGREEDIEAANRIAESMPKSGQFQIMEALSQITELGSTGEPFNARWAKFANPLIVRVFHDIGYKKSAYPNDCTPWCAATTSWCLRRAGHSLPPDPASSQSFVHYGQSANDNPQPGDLCVFRDVGDSSHGHVGMLVSRKGDVLSVLGGNQAAESQTNCGPGYRQSRISLAEIPMNPKRDRKVGVHYWVAFRRPV